MVTLPTAFLAFASTVGAQPASEIREFLRVKQHLPFDIEAAEEAGVDAYTRFGHTGQVCKDEDDPLWSGCTAGLPDCVTRCNNTDGCRFISIWSAFGKYCKLARECEVVAINEPANVFAKGDNVPTGDLLMDKEESVASKVPQVPLSKQQVPRIVHRVLLPRADGDLMCATPIFRGVRDHFYSFNEGWAEYVWGVDAIKALLKKSRGMFEQNDLADFAKLFNNMDQWMFQQDTIRHLILYHFGGVYMDLDMDCQTDIFDIIQDHELVLRGHGKTNFMASTPHQPFFLKMLQRIGAYQKDGDLTKSAVEVTGEHKICATLWEDFGVNCRDDGDIETLIESSNISVKFTGRDEIDNLSDVALCSHNAMSAWTDSDVQAQATAPKDEKELAEGCASVYDEKATWGSALIAKVNGLSL